VTASGGYGASPIDATVTHLHVRSWFSFGAGASSPAKLAREAARLGQSALALTDRNTLAGAVRHAVACRAAGLHAVFGATLFVDEAPLVVLCADGEGYANLCDLLTLAHSHAAEEGDRKTPFLRLEELRERTGGLFCLSSAHDTTLARLLDARQWSTARAFARTLAELFPGRFFIELVHHERAGDDERVRWLIDLAQSLQLPFVATNAVRHATPPEYAVFDALTCMRLGLSVGCNHPERPRKCPRFLCDEKRLLRLVCRPRRSPTPMPSHANARSILRRVTSRRRVPGCQGK
jgi:DNA polymerase III alpha subunit